MIYLRAGAKAAEEAAVAARAKRTALVNFILAGLVKKVANGVMQ
jgi:hypothetical protein